jgi:hypothetical protein
MRPGGSLIFWIQAISLNFSDEQSMKLLNTHISGGTSYVAAFSASLGNTAYMPGNKEVNSQESDLFEQYNSSREDDVFDEVVDGGIIANLQYILGLALTREATPDDDANVHNGDDNSDDDMLVISLGRLTCKAMVSSGIHQKSLQGQQHLVRGMIKEWLEMWGSNKMPPDLAALSRCFGIEVEQGLVQNTPSRMVQ